MHVFIPAIRPARPAAILLFHGGGFVWGGPDLTDGSAQAYAALGLVAFSVEYRLADRKVVTPIEQLEDTYDAMRWVRAHAAEYNIDPDRIAAHGVSAGGALIGMAAGLDDPAVRPNAMVMWSPGVGSLRLEDPYLNELLLGRAQSHDVLPVRHIRSQMPPTIVISGQFDSVTFNGLARQYCTRLTAVGARCDFHSYPGLGHLLSRKLDAASQQRGDFDWDPQATADAEAKVVAFLRSIGFIP
jgi:acetyl esterase/lipase